MEKNKKELLLKLAITIPAILALTCFIWYLFDGTNNLIIGLGFIFVGVFFFLYYLDKRKEDKKQNKETGFAFVLFSIVFLIVGIVQIVLMVTR